MTDDIFSVLEIKSKLDINDSDAVIAKICLLLKHNLTRDNKTCFPL